MGIVNEEEEDKKRKVSPNGSLALAMKVPEEADKEEGTRFTVFGGMPIAAREEEPYRRQMGERGLAMVWFGIGF